MEAETSYGPTSNFVSEPQTNVLPEPKETDETTPVTFNLMAEGAD